MFSKKDRKTRRIQVLRANRTLRRNELDRVVGGAARNNANTNYKSNG